MKKEDREKLLGELISDDQKEKMKKFCEKLGKQLEDFAGDITTLTVSTTYQGETAPAAKTQLYFDGDIDVILPRTGGEIDQQTLDLHQKMVELAMKNRRELLRIFVNLFDLKDLAKII